jgi:hypothetical protein
VKEAVAIAGTLSQPTKMPCHAYSLPASKCVMGVTLNKIKGSVCEKCYALKGRYKFRATQAAMERRLASLTHPYWCDAMTVLIASTREPYFRWHDSGDLQNLQHLMNIVQIAHNLPSVQFWLPTREVGIVRKYMAAFGSFPSNLRVRVSAALVNGSPPKGFPFTSTVVTHGFTCPSFLTQNKCGSCRACWDTVPNIAYKEH